MMKFRPTPFILAAIGFLGLGISYLFSDSNLGPPVGFLVILLSGLCVGLYFALRALFKTRVWTQAAVELAVILTVAIGIYKFNEKVVLRPARNFQGYMYVVYQVDGQPALKLKNIFLNKIDVAVPANGIVLTSSPSPNGMMVNLLVADSLKGEVKLLPPGFGIAYAMDTVICGNKQYRADVFYKGDFPRDWRYRTDTLRRRLKKQEICALLK